MVAKRQDEAVLLAARRHALSDSLRLRIREALTMQPKTVREIGEHLGVIPNRLYYHLRILETAELIEVVGTTSSGRLTEKMYGPAGGNFGDELPGDDPLQRAVFFASILEATKIEFTDNLLADPSSDRDHRPLATSLFRGVVVCTDDDRISFWRDLQKLIESYHDRTNQLIADSAGDPPPDIRLNAITVALCERPQPEIDENAPVAD